MYKPFKTGKGVDLTGMKPGDYALHGDVILERLESLPKGFSKMQQSDLGKNGVLAEGEFTGHAHQLQPVDAPVGFQPEVIEGGKSPLKSKYDIRFEGNVTYMDLKTPMALRHQEHKALELPPGAYKIGIQQERNPYEDRIRALRD